MTAGDGALGASNPRIKGLRRLSGRRSSRSDEGAFVIEGAVLVREALDAGVALTDVFVDVGHGALVAEFDSRTPVVRTVAEGVLASVLPAVSGQPVGAVAATTLARPLDDVVLGAVDAGRPLLVLVDVGDPGNVGTLLRAAESSGCFGVVLAGSGVDPYNPKVVRSAAGSLFRLPFATEPDVGALLVAVAELGLPVVAAVVDGGVPHLDPALDPTLGGAVGLLVGNEAHGLSAEVVAECDAAVSITMDGPTESLNVAMAGTVLCFEAMRRRLG